MLPDPTPFRDFDEDDLESYLEGSIWSEKPSAERYFKLSPDEVITVFPCTSNLSHYPATSCETIFTIRRPTSVHSSFRDEPVYNQNNNNSYKETKVRSHGSYSDIGSPNQGGDKLASRPGSPGPVAGAGDIVNTDHGFTIQLDVKHFRPEEIKVILKDDLLCVSGERIEECGDGQTLRRSFSRKYSIPVDIHLDSIRSHLADNGFLMINGSRRGWKETNLTVHQAAGRHARSGSVISTV